MKKNIFIKIISWTIICLILFFLFKTLITNWQKIKTYHFEINFYFLILSVFVFWFGAFISSLIWRFILAKSGFQLSRWKIFKIHFLSRFGAYVPGKLWPILIRSQLSRKDNVPPKTIVTISLLETAITLVAASVLSLIFMGNYFLGKTYFIATLIVVILGIIILFRPKIFYAILNFGLKKFKKEPISENTWLNSKNLFFALMLNFVLWLVWGISFYFFSRSIFFIPFDKILNLSGIYILSATVGAIVPFAPYGIGVREGIQAYLLKNLFPLEIAILISLLARVWIVISDVSMAAIIQILAFSKKLFYHSNN